MGNRMEDKVKDKMKDKIKDKMKDKMGNRINQNNLSLFKEGEDILRYLYEIESIFSWEARKTLEKVKDIIADVMERFRNSNNIS